MSVDVKICGLKDRRAVDAAVSAGAKFVGFVFYPGSRQVITADHAQELAQPVPRSVTKTGLFVDATDDELKAVLSRVPLDLIQLHGHETPERVTAVKALTGLPVMMAISISAAEHLQNLPAYAAVADRLLFDTRVGDKPSGGTGKTFDWNLLKGVAITKPWMLAGGLKAENLADAVRISGAKTVDVSSGVEDATGAKSPEKIKRLLELAEKL